MGRIEMAKEIRAALAAGKIHPRLREIIGKQALASQRSRTFEPYYSRIRFQATIAAGPPVVMTFVAGSRLAFGYGLGQDMAPAGHGAHLANYADTNVNTSSNTNAGELVKIYGVSILPSVDTDPGLIALLIPKMAVSAVFNGKDTTPLGRPEFMPGGGGFTGSGFTRISEPQWDRTYDFQPFYSNGLPGSGNFYPLPDPLMWKPSGEPDSLFQIKIDLFEAIAHSMAPRAAGGVGSLPMEWRPPSAAAEYGTFLDLIVRLHCRQISRRSANR